MYRRRAARRNFMPVVRMRGGAAGGSGPIDRFVTRGRPRGPLLPTQRSRVDPYRGMSNRTGDYPKKRARTADATTSTQTLSVRQERAAGSGGDLSLSAKIWKPFRQPDLKMLIREFRRSQFTIVQRLQGVNRMNALNTGNNLPGYYSLSNTYDLAPGSSMVPLHVYELTSVRDIQGDPSVAYYMTVTDAGGVVFLPMACQRADGSTEPNGYWQDERNFTPGNLKPSLPGTAGPRRYWTTGQIEIRLNLYGCNTQPTIYDIMLVQPTESWATLDTAPTEYTDARRNVWQGLVRSSTYNPLIGGNNGWRRGLKVIRSWRKVIQPSVPISAGDIADRNPHNHILNIKYYDGKTRDHQYVERAPPSDTIALAGQWTTTSDFTQSYRVNPKPRARLYLIVRALNTTVASIETQTASNTPTYDCVIRRTQYTTV